jgi:hypothetical protein
MREMVCVQVTDLGHEHGARMRTKRAGHGRTCSQCRQLLEAGTFYILTGKMGTGLNRPRYCLDCAERLGFIEREV